MTTQQWSNATGVLVPLILENNRYRTQSWNDISENSLMYTFLADVGGKNGSNVQDGRIKFRAVKTYSEIVHAITSEGTVLGRNHDSEAKSRRGIVNVYHTGTVRDEDSKIPDLPNKYSRKGEILYLTEQGPSIAVTEESSQYDESNYELPPVVTPSQTFTAPYRFIKAQEEFGLTEGGELVQFTDQSNSFSAGGEAGNIVDFAVAQSGGNDRNLITVNRAGEAHLVQIQIQNGAAIVTNVEKLPYPDIVAVYSHWNIPYVLLLNSSGNVIVHHIEGIELESLNLLGKRIIALSDSNCFMVTERQSGETNGMPVAAAYSNGSSFVLIHSQDEPEWIEVGRYKSLFMPNFEPEDGLYGLAY